MKVVELFKTVEKKEAQVPLCKSLYGLARKLEDLELPLVRGIWKELSGGEHNLMLEIRCLKLRIEFERSVEPMWLAFARERWPDIDQHFKLEASEDSKLPKDSNPVVVDLHSNPIGDKHGNT